MKKKYMTKLLAFGVFFLFQTSLTFGCTDDPSQNEIITSTIACIASLTEEERPVFRQQLILAKEDLVNKELLNKNQKITQTDLSSLIEYGDSKRSPFNFEKPLVQKGEYILTFKKYLDFCHALTMDRLDSSAVPFVCRKIDGNTQAALRLFDLNNSAQCEKCVQISVQGMREIFQNRPFNPTLPDLLSLTKNYKNLKKFTEEYKFSKYADEVIGDFVLDGAYYFLNGKAFSDLYSNLPDSQTTTYLLNGTIMLSSLWFVYLNPLLEKVVSY